MSSPLRALVIGLCSLGAVAVTGAGCACDTAPLIEIEPDAGPIFIDPVADGGREDAGPPQDGSVIDDDGGVPDGGGPIESDAGPNNCLDSELGVLPPADADRTVLVAHNFNGLTTIRVLVLNEAGVLVDNGTLIDVGFPVAGLAFVPSGAFALAVAEDGQLASLNTRDPGAITVVDTLALPDYGYGEMHPYPSGDRFAVVSANVTEASGLDIVRIDCKGALTLDENAHFGLRLAYSAAFLPDGRLVVLGGQAVFDPVDVDDMRLLSTDGTGFTQTRAFDIYQDFIDALSIDVSSDGSRVAIPNGSPFSTEGGQLIVATLIDDSMAIETRIDGLADARSARFTSDSQTVVLSHIGPDRVYAFRHDGIDWTLASEVLVGLPQEMERVGRGPFADRFLVSSVSANGQIAVVDVDNAGTLTNPQTVVFGEGAENIPGPIAIAP